ncbi:hypothetical protein [Enterovibrio nigricans]|uniref:Uncharacterized protein n=1 Tax=Enterovibrio nigricans DSM 22720 TaxID=1121868 RepID=A0A1T4UV21_9GAMM|nr:hypothetical protein [Enterovibrio nigricans]SKA56553.1 hypothetical protein SAMN02745132_02581 [Enterovibrio nigricans DSM 22720]
MDRDQLLVEVKSIIGHAVCTIRAGHASQSQRDNALDNLASAMFAIEEHLSQSGDQHD